MQIHYYLNRFGVPDAIIAAFASFFWTALSIAAGYLAKRLELLDTEQAVALAAALRTLVSTVFAYLKVSGPVPTAMGIQEATAITVPDQTIQ